MPQSAAPVTGAFMGEAQSEFDVVMSVTRIHEDPRVTRPYTETQWQAIEALGEQVDRELQAGDVRLTQGGEPTFVSIDDMDGPEWNYTALSPEKRELAGKLALRLKERFAPGSMSHFGQGKWYPGEPLPRWALGFYWRIDGTPIWNDPSLTAEEGKDYGFTYADAKRFGEALAARLGVHPGYLIPAYEDVWLALKDEQQLPVNVDPLKFDLKDSDQRKRLARLLERGLGEPAGYVLPLKPAAQLPGSGRGDRAGSAGPKWSSSRWPLRREHLYLLLR
jgi:uncharacterized protein (DUF2126 family)